MEQVKITILCDGDRVADSLREIANAIEESENQLEHFETSYADAEIDWGDQDDDASVEKFRHLGYYNDTEDLRACTGVSDEEIIRMMLEKEGAFHETDIEETFTLEEIRARQAGQGHFFVRTGDYLVVNETKGIGNPDAAFAEDDPDSPVFVDIYQLVKD